MHAHVLGDEHVPQLEPLPVYSGVAGRYQRSEQAFHLLDDTAAISSGAAGNCVDVQSFAEKRAQRVPQLKLRRLTELKKPDFCGRTGFPDYALQNNNANIRRIKQRIEDLSKRPTEDAERQVKGVRVIEDAGENRMCLVFPGKPEPDVRKNLRGHGFVWSPSRGAWVRKLNNGARYAAQCVLDALPADGS